VKEGEVRGDFDCRYVEGVIYFEARCERCVGCVRHETVVPVVEVIENRYSVFWSM